MIEQLTIFDLEIMNVDEKISGDHTERIEIAFEELLDFSKERLNPVCIHIKDLPKSVKTYLFDFIKNGWAKKTTGTSELIKIDSELLKYHTVDELILEYEKVMQEILENPDVCWYRDVIKHRNGSGPIQYKNENDRELFYIKKKEITKKAALQLGLEHFLSVPSSRGCRLGKFSKWAKKHVLPTLVEHIIPITDIDEMERFFKEYRFFFGRRDWDWELKNTQIPPYPEIKAFSPSEFDLACLVQATDIKTIGLIFEYIGSSSGYLSKEKTIIFPEGWSMEKYEESLTEEDRKLIKEDKERLARLHNYK